MTYGCKKDCSGSFSGGSYSGGSCGSYSGGSCGSYSGGSCGSCSAKKCKPKKKCSKRRSYNNANKAKSNNQQYHKKLYKKCYEKDLEIKASRTHKSDAECKACHDRKCGKKSRHDWKKCHQKHCKRDKYYKRLHKKACVYYEVDNKKCSNRAKANKCNKKSRRNKGYDSCC